jgi:hypothetical protein
MVNGDAGFKNELYWTSSDSDWFGLVLVIALRPQTPKHIRGGWSHYTDTNEPVDRGVL